MLLCSFSNLPLRWRRQFARASGMSALACSKWQLARRETVGVDPTVENTPRAVERRSSGCWGASAKHQQRRLAEPSPAAGKGSRAPAWAQEWVRPAVSPSTDVTTVAERIQTKSLTQPGPVQTLEERGANLRLQLEPVARGRPTPMVSPDSDCERSRRMEHCALTFQRNRFSP
jgi:hypothetical protein